ncbi:serine/threonine protein kinase [Kutzneria sp. 744]|nr:serine/threonine protein kinase [Kutzneria sp. 744]
MPPTPRKTSKRPMLLAALAVVAAAVVGILVANALSGGGNSRADTNGQNPPVQPSLTTDNQPTEVSTAPTSTKKTTTTTTTTTTVTTTTPDGPSPTDLVHAVQGYYQLLPDNSAEAFQHLTPNMQQASGGADSYRQFWAGVDEVKATKVTAAGKDKVSAVVTYKDKAGNTTKEADVFTLVVQDGQLLIDSQSKQSLPD